MTAAVAEVLEEFKKIPGWDRFPLPECIYKEFNIPKPKPYESIMDWARDAEEAAMAGAEGDGLIELREPVEGGVREIGSLPVPEVIVETKTLEDSKEKSD